MIKVYMLRHGETAWNADGNRYCGRTDLPLNEKGISQAEETRRLIKNIDFDGIFSSPLKRAYQTAVIAAGNKNVKTEERLIEVDFGRWEGKTREEFMKENKSAWLNWLRDPEEFAAGSTGENAKSIIGRLTSFYDEIIREYKSGRVLVVAHNGVNRLFLAHKLGMPLGNYRRFSLDNAAVTVFTLGDDGDFVLNYLNASSRFQK